MLDHTAIADIAYKIASAKFKPIRIEKVLVEPTSDMDGRDAIELTVILAPVTVARLKNKGDAAAGTLVSILDHLQGAGDDRFPIIRYATRAELESVGDP